MARRDDPDQREQPSGDAGTGPAGSSAFTIESTADGARHVLTPVGELDLATAPELEGRIRAACARGAKELTVDLSRLSFIDSAGLRATLVGRTLCEEHDCAYRLLPGGPQVQRLFELAGVVDLLTPPDADARKG